MTDYGKHEQVDQESAYSNKEETKLETIDTNDQNALESQSNPPQLKRSLQARHLAVSRIYYKFFVYIT